MATRNVLVKLLTDATGAKAELASTAREVKKFGSYTAEATVKIQTDAAQANLGKLEARLKGYQEQLNKPNANTVDLKIRMGTVARQIERTQAQLRQLTDRPHEVRVGINEHSYLRVRERLGKLGSVSSVVGGAQGLFAAAGGGFFAVEAVKSVAEAYARAQVAQGKLRTQLQALNIDYEDHAKVIETVIQRTSRLSGLDDEDLKDAFTNIIRVTGKVDESLRLTGLAADFARAKHLDVAKAGELVGKVAGGNIGILNRYGIHIRKGATATEALGILQQKFAGQARAYGRTQQGAADRLSVAWENLKEVIGERLAPTLTVAANRAAKFITQMQTGRGEGGRFVRTLRSIAGVLGSIIRFFVRHKAAIAVAVGAWATYRAVAAAAMFATRVRLIRMFLGLAPKAAIGGAEAGAAFGNGFAASAGSALAKFALRYGKFLGPIGVAAGFLINAKNAGPDTAGEKRLLARDLASQDIDRVDPRLAGFPDGGATTAGGRPHPARLPRAASGKSLAQILAGLGTPGQVTSANLQLGLRQAERAYAQAVRQHGGNSPAAIQAAQGVIDARQAIVDARKSGPGSAAARRRRRQAAANPAATPTERAELNAAQRYAAIVRRYGADSPQAKAAKDREAVTGVRAAIQSARDRLATDIRKFGASSEKAIRDRLALSKLQVRLIQANKDLATALQKNTDAHKALLPRLTDVAYHPLAGRLQHAPRQHGLGAVGGPRIHNEWGGVHVTTPSGGSPDAEYLAAQLSRKLAAKGNG